MKPADDPASLAAARQELEAERDRRIQAKIDRGEAVRKSVRAVVGVPEPNRVANHVPGRDEQGRELYYDIDVIITGVPRRGRDFPDSDSPSRTRNANKADENPRRPEGAALRLPEDDPLRAVPHAPVPEPVVSEPRSIRVQIEQPTASNPGGTIAEGYERHTDRRVRVYDVRGELLGGADLRPGDDVEAVAKRLLREKHGASFWGRISYPRGSLH